MTQYLLPVVLLTLTLGCGSGPSARPGSQGPTSGLPDPATASRAGGFRLTLGQEVRATVGSFPPFVGTVQMIRGNRLRLRTDGGEASLRFSSIRVLEVRRQRRDRSVEGGILGTLLGAFLGRFTLLGLGGSHWKAQGRLLAPGLGAIAGGLIGALVGSQILGDYWEPIPVPLTVY